MASKEQKLAIKIAAEIEKSFYNSTKLTKKELEDIAKTAADSSGKIKKAFKDAGESVDKLGGISDKVFSKAASAAKVTAGAIAGIATASIAVGSEFESAFAGVKKTVDATDEELANLEQSIRDMAKDMPIAATEIAGIAEAAGQLGIETENIMNFTKTMADLGVATNLTSEEAATQFARFANITGMAQDNFGRLGSSVVELGNNLATTEAEIASMAMRLAGAGTQVGMSESQILGFAAALSSVGIEAEAGGSALSRVMVDMQLAVETGMIAWDGLESEMKISGTTMLELKNAIGVGGKYLNDFAKKTNYSAAELKKMLKESEKGAGGLEDYAKVAGMSGAEFQKAFKEDAAGAITAFITGLNDLERNGMSAIAVLDSMDIKDVRLRDALLRAANAGDLFTDSIELSSKAWEENTALTKEAEQRYETFKRRLIIFNNTLKDAGIETYKSIREPLGRALEIATQFTKDLPSKIKSKLPTVKRELKEFTTEFLNFADPVLSLGKWMIQNPKIIASTLAGIGAALATFKVAQGIKAVATSFSALGLMLTNPFIAALMATAAAIGIGTGIATAIKQADAAAKKQNLAEHFGKISLSMEELQKVAEHIIESDSLKKAQETLSAIDGLEEIHGTINNTVEELNKANWKVSIGMKLTKGEKKEYKKNIGEYIDSVQEVVNQSQYAVILSIEALLADTADLKKNNIVNIINKFYEGKQQELAKLGENLSKTVTEAFSDKLLDIDEVKEITELQSQMAKIQSAITDSKFDAQMEMLQLKYSGGDLDSESFQNLIDEIAKQTQAAIDNYDESFVLSMSNAKIMLEEKAISQKVFDEMSETIKEGYLTQKVDVQLKANKFLTDTIMEQYKDELGTAMPEIEKIIEEAVQNSANYINNELGEMEFNWSTLFGSIEGSLGFLELDESGATKQAISSLFEQMKPSVEELSRIKKQFEEMGKEVPTSLQNGLNDVSILGAISEDANSIWELIGNTASGEKYKEAFKKVQESGESIPQSIASAINNGEIKTTQAIQKLYGTMSQRITTQFKNGFNVDMPINFNVKSNFSIKDGFNLKNGLPGVGYNADGGIIKNPILTTFAEEGPEAAIPLDGSRNAINLWETTGQILGVYQKDTGNKPSNIFDSFQASNDSNSFKSLSNELSVNNTNTETRLGDIHYNPILNFYGDAPKKEDINTVIKKSEDEFIEKLERWYRDKKRNEERTLFA